MKPWKILHQSKAMINQVDDVVGSEIEGCTCMAAKHCHPKPNRIQSDHEQYQLFSSTNPIIKSIINLVVEKV